MVRRLIPPLIILPGAVLVFIPLAILWGTQDSTFSAKPASAHQLHFWLGLSAGSIGLGLCVWTVKIFLQFGEGTPAPWDPPKKLVVRGPYCHVRNPMIIGVLLLLFAEAMLLTSWPIAVWMIIFFVGNAIYFPFVEEKGLIDRYGDTYRKYTIHVPRWIPRILPWVPGNDD